MNSEEIKTAQESVTDIIEDLGGVDGSERSHCVNLAVEKLVEVCTWLTIAHDHEVVKK